MKRSKLFFTLFGVAALIFNNDLSAQRGGGGNHNVRSSANSSVNRNYNQNTNVNRNVNVNQNVNVNRQVIKGGILKLAIKIKGWEMPGGWKAYCASNLPQIMSTAPTS